MLASGEFSFDMIEQERAAIENQVEAIDAIIERHLTSFTRKNPDHPFWELQVRAGVGGEDAAIFAKQLCQAYIKFIPQLSKQMLEFKDEDDEELGEFRIIDESRVVMERVLAEYFQYEVGVHRVQRVPPTESRGRVHTSTVSITLLPRNSLQGESGFEEDVEEIAEVDEREIRMDAKRASGPGGQHMHKSNSSVRLVHLPTGVTVCNQDERSQHAVLILIYTYIHMLPIFICIYL